MIDLKFDKITHDLAIESSDLRFVEGRDEMLQNLKIRLLFIGGEWFLDTEAGVPYFDEVWIKNPDPALVDDIFKSVILETEGIVDLVEFNSEYNTLTRKYTLSFKANSIYGQVSLEEVIADG